MNSLIVVAMFALLAVGCNKIEPGSIGEANVNSANNNSTAENKEMFVDTTHEVSLNYKNLNMQTAMPDSYLPVQSNFGETGKDLLALYLNSSLYKGTNLESAWFNLAVNDKTDSKTCYALIKDAGFTTGFDQKRIVQGVIWYFARPNPIGDAGAGHSGTTETYRLYKNNTCYEVRIGLSGFNRQNLENPNSVKEYDPKQIYDYLGEVFNNLQVK